MHQSEIYYRPRSFSEESVKRKIQDIVEVLNTEVFSEEAEERYIEEATRAIADLLDVDLFIDAMTDVLGYASYTGSDDEDQSGEPALFAAQDLYFDGVKILRPTGEAQFKALLVFSEELELPIDDDDDEITKSKFYFIEPDNIVMLDPGVFERLTSKQLTDALERYALQSEIVVNSNTFKSATAQNQKNMLINQAQKAGEFIEAKYSGDTIEVLVDTFTMLWPGEDGQGVQHVSPANSKGDRKTQIVGKTEGCTFIELLLGESWEKPLTKLMHNHPSIVIKDVNEDVIYLVPLRAINQIEVIKTQF